jgi:hypothetical protein
MAKIKSISGERVKRVQAFLGDAYNDYIAARVLLLTDLPQQGAILACTAIEKYLKAILAFRGNERHGHLQKAHWNALKNFDPVIYSQLNPSFLKLLQKCYGLRYTDSLKDGFNLVIASREFLAELDFTAQAIQQMFTVVAEGKKNELKWDLAVSMRDARLLRDNHVALGLDKEQYVYGLPQRVYEVRKDPVRGVMEVMYTTDTPPIDRDFLRSGLLPKGKGHMSYDMSHKPMEKKHNQSTDTSFRKKR